MSNHSQPRHAEPRRRTTLQLFLASLLLAGLTTVTMRVPTTHAATITVTTAVDERVRNGACSLREAIIAANDDRAVDSCPRGTGVDRIILPKGRFVFGEEGTDEDNAHTGDLDIKEDVIITGAGPAFTTIDAHGLDRVLEILTANVQLSSLSITGGDWSFGSGIVLAGGDLTISDSRITGNANGRGVQISFGSLTLIESRVDSHASGGINIYSGGTAVLIDSVVHGNTAEPLHGGGINNQGTLILVNSTVSSNDAPSSGGGIMNSGTTSLYSTTVSNNTAGSGGGVFVLDGALRARNSIIGGNSASQNPDCYGDVTGQGYILIENTTGCTILGNPFGNVTGVSPRLDPLRDNGGGTLTHALRRGSPAIDAGNPLGCADQNRVDLVADQRGFVRSVDGNADGDARCDMGAHEYRSPGAPTATTTLTVTTRTPTTPSTPTQTATSRTPPPVPTGSATPTATTTATSAATTTPTTTRTSPTATSTPFYRLYLPSLRK